MKNIFRIITNFYSHALFRTGIRDWYTIRYKSVKHLEHCLKKEEEKRKFKKRCEDFKRFEREEKTKPKPYLYLINDLSYWYKNY